MAKRSTETFMHFTHAQVTAARTLAGERTEAAALQAGLTLEQARSAASVARLSVDCAINAAMVVMRGENPYGAFACGVEYAREVLAAGNGVVREGAGR